MLRQPNNRNQPYQSPVSRSRVWPGLLWLAVLLALALAGMWQRQAINDWIRLYGYTPPPRISELASQTTMTGPAEHLFYLNRPEIASTANFSQYCSEREQTIVLGCYHGGESGIYILQIANSSELHGVMQVTAAHEMLHAAYERLSDGEKVRINQLLQNYYDSGKISRTIKAEIDAYRSSEPGQLLNEMHSIFGTEVANLPKGLETYYQRYFTHRSAVVAQAERYEDAFRSREMAVKNYDKQLATLEQKIKSNEQLLQQEARTLAADRAKLEAYKTSGDISAYNAAVPGYNAEVVYYNNLLATTKSQIDQYNQIVQKRNALVVEEQDLVQQLTGKSLPTTQ